MASYIAADLTRAVAFGNTALNTVTQGSEAALSGCKVTLFDASEVEVRQFTEPLALGQGLEVGGVWYGARHVRINGIVYGTTRGAAFDAIGVLEAAFDPTAIYIATPASFGYGSLTWYVKTASTATQRTLYCRPNGLHVAITDDMFGGPDSAPLGIPWSVTLLAKVPTIT